MKNNFKGFLFILIGIVSVFGKCNKVDINQCSGNCYNIVGVVKDSLSNTPILNAAIEIATINSANFYSGTYGTGFTNSSGIYNLFYPNKGIDFINFQISITIKPPVDYIADNFKENAILYTLYASDSVSVNVPVIRNASFLKKAFLNVRIIKANSGNNLNSFISRFGKFGYKTLGIFPSTNNTDTTYRFETAAEIKNYLSWEVKTNSNTTNKFLDSLVIAPGKTRDYVITL